MKKAIIRTVQYFEFKCPACGHAHNVPINSGENTWKMSGTDESPTLEPSILNYIPKEKIVDDKTIIEKTEVCHLFIRSGQIEYLSDSQHHLAGNIIDMQNIE